MCVRRPGHLVCLTAGKDSTYGSSGCAGVRPGRGGIARPSTSQPSSASGVRQPAWDTPPPEARLRSADSPTGRKFGDMSRQMCGKDDRRRGQDDFLYIIPLSTAGSCPFLSQVRRTPGVLRCLFRNHDQAAGASSGSVGKTRSASPNSQQRTTAERPSGTNPSQHDPPTPVARRGAGTGTPRPEPSTYRGRAPCFPPNHAPEPRTGAPSWSKGGGRSCGVWRAGFR
jgi:hypothetical protein